MRRIAIFFVLALALLGGLSWAGGEPTAAAPPKAPPTPVDGMLCTGGESAESPTVLEGGLAELLLPVGGGGPPACPVNFSNCVDVPGRKCSLQNCATVDLEIHTCQKPNGQVLSCTGGTTLHQTTCDCLERLHMTCCDDDSCGFECGVCTGGSLTTVCQ